MNQLWNVEKYLPGTNWSESSAAMFWKGLQGGQIDRQVSFQNHVPSLTWYETEICPVPNVILLSKGVDLAMFMLESEKKTTNWWR